MTYAAILTHVRAAPEGLAALTCARALADTFDATLIGVAAETVPPPPPDDGYSNLSGPWFASMPRDRRSQPSRRRRRAVPKRSPAGLPSSSMLWECGLRMPEAAMASAASSADLIVATCGDADIAPTPIARFPPRAWP